MVALIISVASVQAQKSQVIAHRGYWKTAGSAQNSITAHSDLRALASPMSFFTAAITGAS